MLPTVRRVLPAALSPILALLMGIAAAPAPLLGQEDRGGEGERVLDLSPGATPREHWSIVAEPLLSVGGPDAVGPAQFAEVAGVVRLDDGAFAVGDFLSREIRVFEPDGSHRATFGGEGEGPGEFTSLWSLWKASDELVVRDGSRRLHFLAQDGDFHRVTPPAVHPEYSRLDLRGVLADGSALGIAVPPLPDDATGRFLIPVVVVRVSEETAQVVGEFPGYYAIRERAADPPGFEVFGPQFQMAVLADRFCVGFSEAIAFTCHDPDGRELLRVRAEGVQPWAVTAADREAFFSEIALARGVQPDDNSLAEVRRETRFAEVMPAFGPMLGAATGELWLGPFIPAEGTRLGTLNPSPLGETSWAVFDSGGNWLAQVTLPARFRPSEVGWDYVAGIRRDAWDVEYVEVYRLIR